MCCRKLNRKKLLSWTPVIVELLIILFCYCVYVVSLCVFTSNVLAEKIVLLIVFHLIFSLTMWSYYKATFTRTLLPPQKFHMSESEWSTLTYNYHWQKNIDEMENLRSRLKIWTTPSFDGQGVPFYCYNCKLVKPDRCHHCSQCGVCVLKMDHHCPWINNCVGFHNYKYFLLLLIYVKIYCVFVFLTSLRFIYQFFLKISHGEDVSDDYNRILILTMTIVAVLVGLSITPLLKLHISLILQNVTTLENSRPVGLVGTRPSDKTFNFGARKNLSQVFGEKKRLWFFPVFTSLGDGAYFPIVGFAPTDATQSTEDKTDDVSADDVVGNALLSKTTEV